MDDRLMITRPNGEIIPCTTEFEFHMPQNEERQSALGDKEWTFTSEQLGEPITDYRIRPTAEEVYLHILRILPRKKKKALKKILAI